MSVPVTLTLIAYNQENYVREAIESALAQTFSPLEIILSDDCSPDQTFAIMQEMVESYRGPHRVHARREPVNVGTVQHLINVSRAAQGELVVIAAGDDLSYPDRVTALYEAWAESGAAAMASWHDEIDNHGTMLRKDVSFPPSDVVQKIYAAETHANRNNGVIETVPGFCAAYPRSFWADLPDPPGPLLAEDGFASAMIILRREKIQRVPRSLIGYRLLGSSLTVRTGGLGVAEIRDRERKISFRARDLVSVMNFTIDQVGREGLDIHPRTMMWFRNARNHGMVTADFWEIGPVARVLRLFRVRIWDDARFLMPRLFGFRLFAALRRMFKK